MKYMKLIDSDGTKQKIYVEDKDGDKVQTVFENDSVLKANQADRLTDGFDITRMFRRVARINMDTVRLLAIQRKDADALAYMNYHDEAARDRMIRNYPHLFKACSGGV